MKKKSLLFIFTFISLSCAVVAYLISKLFFETEIEKNISIYFSLSSFFTSLIFVFCIYFYVEKKAKNILMEVKKFRNPNDLPTNKIEESGNYLETLNTEIEEWADERKEELDRLKKLEDYRREFLGNVSHELKTPIFNIQGYVLTLLDGALEDKNVNRNYLQRAEKSVDRMITIVGDLESISQLETGELQLEQEQIDIAALAQDVIEAQELKATAKGIVLAVQADKSVWVVGDRFRIRQVLVNLIVNSVKYGKEFGETKIRFFDVGENISIEISDNGIGIAEEHLPRLFERFYRVDKSRSREMGGTGLGLAIVKHIIEAHNSTINVMSTEGVGTVFSFALKKAETVRS